MARRDVPAEDDSWVAFYDEQAGDGGDDYGRRESQFSERAPGAMTTPQRMRRRGIWRIPKKHGITVDATRATFRGCHREEETEPGL